MLWSRWLYPRLPREQSPQQAAFSILTGCDRNTLACSALPFQLYDILFFFTFSLHELAAAFGLVHAEVRAAVNVACGPTHTYPLFLMVGRRSY